MASTFGRSSPTASGTNYETGNGNLLEQGADFLLGLFGGGGDPPAQSWEEFYARQIEFGSSCPGQPSAASMRRVVEQASDAELQRIIDQLKASNAGWGPASREELARTETMNLWVVACMGGGDCENKSAPWLVQYIQDLARKYSGTGSLDVSSYDAPEGIPQDDGRVQEFFESLEDFITGQFEGSGDSSQQGADVATIGESRYGGVSPTVLLVGAGIAAYFILR